MWRSDFGDVYVERNLPTEDRIRTRVRAFSTIFDSLSGAAPRSIVECGANVGINLRALDRLSNAELFAIEPNQKARERAISDGVLPAENMKEVTLEKLPFDDGSIDLVFTSGVLIHVPPADLEQAYREMHRVSSRYLLSIEYFSKKPETIPYRGHDELLFKRDFGGMWLDLFPDLEPVAQGFFWIRTTGLDDLTWWLFRKPGA